MTRTLSCAVLLALAATGAASAQSVRFEDVVRNLRNPDPGVRLEAVRLLREAQHREAIVPLAPLVNDPVERVQLEAMAAALSFFLVEEVPERRRVALVFEVRDRGGAMGAFERGPLAVWPRPLAPSALVTELLKAVDDEDGRVRIQAIYAVGLVGRGGIGASEEEQLLKALDHYDPDVRTGAARVIGRLGVTAAGDGLVKAINDSDAQVRHAAMRALGALREDRAVVALTEQLEYYGRGDGARAAMDGLSLIAHRSSVPVFVARLGDRDPDIRRAAAEGLGRAGDVSARSALESGATTDPSAGVRAAMAYALQKVGGHYVPRLIEFLDNPGAGGQVQAYLIELGPSVERDLIPSLQEPDAGIRTAVAEVLGEIGGEAAVAALEAARSRDRRTAQAASRALERISRRRMP
jgi:HEAT repeat protein